MKRIDLKLSFTLFAGMVMLALPIQTAEAQTQARMIGIGRGTYIGLRYYGGYGFAGNIRMDIDGQVTDSFCVQLYQPISNGDILILNGPLDDRDLAETDWCAVNYILNNYQPTSNFEAGAIQSAIWHITTAHFGPYTGTPGQKYQFMSDQVSGNFYDGYDFASRHALRQRAQAMLDSVPRDGSGECISSYPNDIRLDVEEIGPGNFSLTANVFDQKGRPMSDVIIHFVSEDGPMAPTQGGLACVTFPGSSDETSSTDPNGQATMQFQVCTANPAPLVSAWVEGQYGSHLYDPAGQRQNLTTLHMRPFSLADTKDLSMDFTPPRFVNAPESVQVDCSCNAQARAEGSGGAEKDSASGSGGGNGIGIPVLETEIPPVPDVEVVDNMDPNPQVRFTETPFGECPGMITRIWTATDATDNVAEHIQLIVLRKNCTEGADYWAENPDAWLSIFGPVEDLELGCPGETTSAADALALLGTESSGDESVRLMHALIAASLNVAQGADDTIAATLIQNGRDFFCAVPFDSDPQGEMKKAAKDLRKSLEAFNRGKLTAPECDCGGSGSGGGGASSGAGGGTN